MEAHCIYCCMSTTKKDHFATSGPNATLAAFKILSVNSMNGGGKQVQCRLSVFISFTMVEILRYIHF